MSEKVLHTIDIENVVASSIYGIILGLILTFVPVSLLVDLIMIIIGAIIIIMHGTRVYKSMSSNEKTSNKTLLDVIGVLAGFLLMVAHNLVVTIIIAIYLIVQPLVELYLSKFERNKINVEIPKVILGALLLVAGFSAFDIIFKAMGIIILVASLAYFLLNYYFYKKSKIKVKK